MEDTPVYYTNQILHTILKCPKSVNDIVNDTGIYKKNVLKRYLPMLEKDGLIIRYKNKEIHKQKEFLKLTKLGIEFTNFFNEMDKFDEAHPQLRSKIKESFGNLDKRNEQENKRILRNKGWEEQEINSYDELAGAARFLESILLSMYINVPKK